MTRNAPVWKAASSTWLSRSSVEGLKTNSKKEVISARCPAARFDDVVSGRCLLPGIGHDDPDGAEDRSQGHHDGGKEVHLRADPVPTEEQQRQKTGLQEEGEDAFGGERAAEHIADKPRVGSPVGAELELHHDAGGHADGKHEAENPHPEAGHRVVQRTPGCQVGTLHDNEDQTQADGERGEDVMEGDRQRKLQPCQH